MRFAFFVRRSATLLSAVIVAFHCVSLSVAYGDVLSKPAFQSPLARNSVLTAIARAGARLVAVGERGHILYSDDEGANWRQAQAPVSTTLTNIFFADARSGWATGHGGVILATTDGGATWSKQLDGNGVIQAVENAARIHPDLLDIAEEMKADGPDKPFLDVYFQDSRKGIVIGAYGLVFTTQDAGASWEYRHNLLPNPERKHLYAIRGAGTDIFIVGEQGAIFSSRDGGAGFSAVQSPYVGSFFGLLALSDGKILAFGLRGNLFFSPDRGGRWSKIDLGAEHSLTAGTILSDGRIALVDLGGGVWLSQAAEQGFAAGGLPKLFSLTGVTELSNGNLMAVGVRGTATLPLAQKR